MANRAGHVDAKVRLDERHFAGVDSLNGAFADINAYDFNAIRCQDSGRRKADVTKSDNSHTIDGVQNAPHIGLYELDSHVFRWIAPKLHVSN
ncbi:hypothetical protein StoSoilB20_32960 [Arthrobacter sp. StoSoilB20]|nr:hypothetical protein StoSoilB20_32960 [Arthrobacter sp. StoSoilB20]